jgi:type II secretory pathway pseudopilin PulG
MKKGVTPVVATVLLILLSIASTVVVYQVYESTRDNTNVGEDIGLESDNVRFESCWQESGNSYISARNDGSEAINTSKMNLFLDGAIQDESNYSISPDIVEPQRTFEVEILNQIGSDTQVMLGVSGNTVSYRCAF